MKVPVLTASRTFRSSVIIPILCLICDLFHLRIKNYFTDNRLFLLRPLIARLRNEGEGAGDRGVQLPHPELEAIFAAFCVGQLRCRNRANLHLNRGEIRCVNPALHL